MKHELNEKNKTWKRPNRTRLAKSNLKLVGLCKKKRVENSQKVGQVHVQLLQTIALQPLIATPKITIPLIIGIIVVIFTQLNILLSSQLNIFARTKILTLNIQLLIHQSV